MGQWQAAERFRQSALVLPVFNVGNRRNRGADWNASWQRTTVNDDQWKKLRADLRAQAAKWQKVVSTRPTSDDIAAKGTKPTATAAMGTAVAKAL